MNWLVSRILGLRMHLMHELFWLAGSLPGLMQMLMAPTGSYLNRAIRSRPELLKILFASYVAANWTPQEQIVPAACDLYFGRSGEDKR